MSILDTILGFFGIRRINLDKPLTLLGQYYYKVLDKIYSSAYGLEEDVDILFLRQALSRLPEREKEIVTMRFGLEGRKELTQKEVAQKMGISQSYISRLEKRIMLRLRKEFNRLTGCA